MSTPCLCEVFALLMVLGVTIHGAAALILTISSPLSVEFQRPNEKHLVAIAQQDKVIHKYQGLNIKHATNNKLELLLCIIVTQYRLLHFTLILMLLLSRWSSLCALCESYLSQEETLLNWIRNYQKTISKWHSYKKQAI